MIPPSVLARRPTRPLTVAEYQSIKSGASQQSEEAPEEVALTETNQLQSIIDSNVTEVNTRIKQFEQKIVQQEKNIQDAYDYYKQKSKKFPKKESEYRKDYERQKDDYQNKIKEYDYQVKFLREGLNYASEGYELGSIYNYVDSKVNYYMAKSEARKQAEKAYQDASKQLEGKYITPAGFITPYKPQGDYAKQFQQVQINFKGKKPITYFQYVKPQQPLELSRPDLQSREPEKIDKDLYGGSVVYATPQPETFQEKAEAYLYQKSKSRNLYGFVSFGAGVGSSVLSNIYFFKEAVTKPVQTTKNIYSSGKEVVRRVKTGEGFPEVGRKLREEPAYSTGYVVGEVLFQKGLKKVPSPTETTKLSFDYLRGKYRPVAESKIKDVPSSVLGREKFDITLAEGVSSTAEPLSKQARRAGETSDLVSGQRNLLNAFKKEIPVRKPIPNEELLTKETKELLRKFDEGTLDKSKYSELNRRIIKESGSKGLLERSMFFDPESRIRQSRLGITPEDVMEESTGITFRKPKPQIVVAEKTLIEGFPEELSDIEKALKSGKSLTSAQADRLLEFQLTKSGKAKPIGFLGRESEVTFAPGELVRKKKFLASTRLGGRRVPIYSVEVYKPSKEISSLLNKLESGELNLVERNKLFNKLSKETGFSKSEVYSSLEGSKYVSPYRLVSFGVSKTSLFSQVSTSSSQQPSKGSSNKTSISKSFSSNNKSPKIFSSLGSSEISIPLSPIQSAISSLGSTTPSSIYYPKPSPGSPPSPTPKTPTIKTPDLTFPGEKRKEEQGYDAYAYVDATKRNKAFYRKLNRVPLTQESALSMTAREVDKTISARGKIAKAKPVKQKGRVVKATVVDTRDKYYSENSYKFRSYSGKKMKPLPTGTIIEKQRFRLDSRGETRKIQKEKARSVRSVFGF